MASAGSPDRMRRRWRSHTFQVPSSSPNAASLSPGPTTMADAAGSPVIHRRPAVSQSDGREVTASLATSIRPVGLKVAMPAGSAAPTGLPEATSHSLTFSPAASASVRPSGLISTAETPAPTPSNEVTSPVRR